MTVSKASQWCTGRVTSLIKRNRRSGPGFLATSLIASCFALLVALPASASTVTVGPMLPLPNPFPTRITCGSPCTLTNASLPSGASYRSPVDGVIVRLRLHGVKGASYRLRVITPLDGSQYLGAGSSSWLTPAEDVETFPVSLPIRSGQMIGIDLKTSGTPITWESAGSAPILQWEPQLPDGVAQSAFGGDSLVFAFNADVQPPPGLSSISPSSGPSEGGTQVVISGHDFSGATGVSFGGTPASFTVNSDNEVIAAAPPGNRSGPVGVTVRTAAGVTPDVPAGQFTYLAAIAPSQSGSAGCVVPNLKGKRLKRAKRHLRNAGCAIGRIKKIKGAPVRAGRISRQHPSSGSILAHGAKINVVLRKPSRKQSHR
jgi:hypothetical protein